MVGSTSFHDWPDLGVGGSGLPLIAVISLPPVVGLYCPDLGAGVPGLFPRAIVGLTFPAPWGDRRKTSVPVNTPVCELVGSLLPRKERSPV